MISRLCCPGMQSLSVGNPYLFQVVQIFGALKSIVKGYVRVDATLANSPQRTGILHPFRIHVAELLDWMRYRLSMF